MSGSGEEGRGGKGRGKKRRGGEEKRGEGRGREGRGGMEGSEGGAKLCRRQEMKINPISPFCAGRRL